MKNQTELAVIGRAERISFVDLGIQNVPAKIDTGADLSSVWAGHIKEDKCGLHCVLFDKGSKYYTGEKLTISPSNYSVTRIANSFGHKEIRYKVKLRVEVKGRIIRATFTLSDRSKKTYPILLGRSLLKGKFVVDVTQGDPLIKMESLKAKKLLRDLKRNRKEKP